MLGVRCLELQNLMIWCCNILRLIILCFSMNYTIGEIVSYSILLHIILKSNSVAFNDCSVEYDQGMSEGRNEYKA